MKAKEYLSQYKLLNSKINDRLEQLENLQSMALRITPVQGDGSAHSGSSDKIGSIVAKIVDLERAINSDIDRLIKLKMNIESVIKSVNDDVLETLLIKRYINCKTFEQIAVEMHYTYQWVCVLHGKALRKIKYLIVIDT